MKLHEMFVYVSRVQQIFNAGISASKRSDFKTKTRTATLIRWDKNGEYIYAAGAQWAKFDYEAGFEALLQRKSSSKWIAEASKHWPKFDYERAKAELERRGDNHWISQMPRGAKETIEAGEEIKKSASKMPKKPFGLKEWIKQHSLKEAMQFKSSIEGQGRTRVVMNPSVEEINNVAMTSHYGYGNTAHFIFDAAKKHFYVFSPNEYHSRVMVELGLSTIRQNTGDYPHGSLKKIGENWKIDSIKGISHENYKKVENYIKNKYLKEEYQFGLKSTWGTWEKVYEVTSPKDLKDAMGKNDDIRFLADAKSKELYVFSSNLSHTAVTDKLHINAYGYEQPIIAGRAQIVNGRWTAIDAINIWSATEALKSASTFDKFKKYLQDILNADWSFAKKYIDLHIIVKEIKDKVTEKPQVASVGLKEAKAHWEGNKDQDVAARDFWDRSLEHNELRMKNETNAGASLALRIENAGDIIRELGKSWADSGYINEKIERITNNLTYSRDWNDPLSLKEIVYLNNIKKKIEEIPESSKLTPKVKELLRSIANRKVGKISASLNDFREAFY